MAVGSVAGTQLAVRAGTRLIVTAGLVAMAVFYGWVAATTSASLSYGIIAVQMVLYGLGMGLSSAPATESIMGAISRSRAGVGSAVNDATRLIGGTLGVAVIGSVYASVYGHGSPPPSRPGCPPRSRRWRTSRSARPTRPRAASRRRRPPVVGQALRLAATNAFLRGLTVGALVAGGVAAAGAILAALLLPASRPRRIRPLPSVRRRRPAGRGHQPGGPALRLARTRSGEGRVSRSRSDEGS